MQHNSNVDGDCIGWDYDKICTHNIVLGVQPYYHKVLHIWVKYLYCILQQAVKWSFDIIIIVTTLGWFSLHGDTVIHYSIFFFHDFIRIK